MPLTNKSDTSLVRSCSITRSGRILRRKRCRSCRSIFPAGGGRERHALRFIKYVADAGGRVVIPAIDAPKSKFKTPRDAVKLSLDQEIHVTQQINGLVALARKQNDYITINFLQWFLTEQLEEVSSMDNLLKIIERAGNDLLQADEYLARVGLRTMPEPAKQ